MKSESAVIVGAEGGIGQAFANALEEENHFESVVRFSRSHNSPVKLDICEEGTIIESAKWLADNNISPTMVFVASGLLHKGEHRPEKSLNDIDPDWLAENYRVNAIGPTLIAKHFLPLMPTEVLTKFAVLSARVGSISDNRLGGWYGYRAAKAALNMMIRNLSIEWSRKHKRSIIVALHPGTVNTPLSAPFQANVPAGKLFDADRAALQLLDVLDELKPSDTGKIFAWDSEEIAP